MGRATPYTRAGWLLIQEQARRGQLGVVFVMRPLASAALRALVGGASVSRSKEAG